MKKELLVPTSWWNSTKATVVGNLGPLGGMLLDQAMASKATLYSGHCQGFLEHPDLEEGKKYLLEALVEKTGAHTPYTEGPIFGRGTFDTWLTWDTGAIQLKIGLDNKLSVTVSCLDESTYMLVADTLGEHILPDHVRQPVYSLAEGPQGVEIIEVGLAGQDFEDDNYEAETVEGFYSIAAELQRDNPIGRLVILEGSPGSGKTFLVRGLIHEVLDAIFVLVPPHLVDSLAGPQLVPMLVRARGMAGTNRPIVLVIEDADKALVPRDEGSLAAISALLNVSDGILGHALNIRVLCTTNATIDEIDSALLRPGRLSRHLHLGDLSPEKAKEVFMRLTNGEKGELEFDKPTSLAQVYETIKALQIMEDEEDEEEDAGDDDEDDEDDDDEDDDEDEDDEDDDE